MLDRHQTGCNQLHAREEARELLAVAGGVLRLLHRLVDDIACGSSASGIAGRMASLAHTRSQGDNDEMASDDSKAPPPYRWTLMLLLDGGRPSRALGWVSLVAPVVTQAAAGAGHWAAGRRQRALAEWAGAAGFGLVAWGLGTEAPTRAEVEKSLRQQMDVMRKLGREAPATTGTETPTARRLSRYFRWSEPVFPVAGMVIGVPWRLRHPRRLTVLATANEAPTVVFSVLRAARAVQRRRPRMAAGSALVAAGSLARLRAASAEPLR